MAKRKSRTVKRTTKAARAGTKTTFGKKAADLKRALTRERRRREVETLRLRSFEPSFTVSDIERSVRFYSDVLGFIVIEQMSDGAVLQGVLLKAGVCKLGLSQDDWSKGRDRKKGEGMRIWCQTAQDIDALARRITAAGGRLVDEPKNQQPGLQSLSVTDPDGFHLTIYREL